MVDATTNVDTEHRDEWLLLLFLILFACIIAVDTRADSAHDIATRIATSATEEEVWRFVREPSILPSFSINYDSAMVVASLCREELPETVVQELLALWEQALSITRDAGQVQFAILGSKVLARHGYAIKELINRVAMGLPSDALAHDDDFRLMELRLFILRRLLFENQNIEREQLKEINLLLLNLAAENKFSAHVDFQLARLGLALAYLAFR